MVMRKYSEFSSQESQGAQHEDRTNGQKQTAQMRNARRTSKLTVCQLELGYQLGWPRRSSFAEIQIDEASVAAGAKGLTWWN